MAERRELHRGREGGVEDRTLDDLTDYLKRRRILGYRPPVLLLGAGASFEAGIGTMRQLFEFTGVKDFDEFVAYIRGRSADERYIHLSGFLQTQAPAEVTPGYQSLAALLAENYFDLVLSTNFDPLLEDALAHARLWRKDYMLLVNGIVRPDRLDLILKEPSPRVKIIKLHGDLFHRYMAWTPEEMDAFIDDIRPRLKKALLGRDIIIVGYSLGDRAIRDLVLKAGGPDSTIWYLHFQEIAAALHDNPRVRGVVDPSCKFEQLFPRLARALDVEVGPELQLTDARPKFAPPPPAAAPSAARPTLDDLMASIVGLAPGEDPSRDAACTGFVIAEPRLIVTEGFSGGAFSGPAQVVVPDGRRLPTRVVRRDTSHPFGSVCFEVPAELHAPGLRLDPDPFALPLSVRIGVAAGERVGISSGAVTAVERRMTISPVEASDHLAVVDAAAAPGSAGAPVVDAASLAVRGYVVGGSMDGPTIMYPAYRWAHALVGG